MSPGDRDKDRTREPERYPSVRQDDAVERTGRIEEVAGERGPPAPHPGTPGPEDDPAEGKRR